MKRIIIQAVVMLLFIFGWLAGVAVLLYLLGIRDPVAAFFVGMACGVPGGFLAVALLMSTEEWRWIDRLAGRAS